MFLSAPSVSAQLSVPLLIVKSVPSTAFTAVVDQFTDAAPDVPPRRATGIRTLPAPSWVSMVTSRNASVPALATDARKLATVVRVSFRTCAESAPEAVPWGTPSKSNDGDEKPVMRVQLVLGAVDAHWLLYAMTVRKRCVRST